jgi:hypothetical protein
MAAFGRQLRLARDYDPRVAYGVQQQPAIDPRILATPQGVASAPTIDSNTPRAPQAEQSIPDTPQPAISTGLGGMFGRMGRPIDWGKTGTFLLSGTEGIDRNRKNAESDELKARMARYRQSLPADQQAMLDIDPDGFVKAQQEALTPAYQAVGDTLVQTRGPGVTKPVPAYQGQPKTEFGWHRNPDGSLAPVIGGPADPAYKRETNPKSFVINTGADPKPPSGYRRTADGNLEPIPGGPAAQKLATSKAKADGLIRQVTTSASNVLAAIDTAQRLSGEGSWGTTGLVGSVAKNVPGNAAYDLSKALETIKANIGFDKLAEMRANSPTGGALGNVSDRETSLLSAVITALDQSQSPEQFRANLGRVKAQYQRTIQSMKDAYAEDYGGDAASGASPSGAPERREGVPANAQWDAERRRWVAP